MRFDKRQPVNNFTHRTSRKLAVISFGQHQLSRAAATYTPHQEFRNPLHLRRGMARNWTDKLSFPDLCLEPTPTHRTQIIVFAITSHVSAAFAIANSLVWSCPNSHLQFLIDKAADRPPLSGPFGMLV